MPTVRQLDFVFLGSLGSQNGKAARRAIRAAGGAPTSAAIRQPVQRCRRSAPICSTKVAGVGRWSRLGREEQSSRPACPSVWTRATLVLAVRSHTATHQITSTIRRTTGIPLDVHSVHRVCQSFTSFSFLGQHRVDNLLSVLI